MTNAAVVRLVGSAAVDDLESNPEGNGAGRSSTDRTN